ncbi:hypothetical protein TorRG33x02_274570 [Trema orientale]|uniref:Uncharacterized protein n=1 Tax=Trema orientale TaxID=63057 RepID=A0A2P5CSA6_TREOI|nr:hypothetical protein TorRG33x02_274570 [Trema orientale]
MWSNIKYWMKDVCVTGLKLQALLNFEFLMLIGDHLPIHDHDHDHAHKKPASKPSSLYDPLNF